MKDAFFAFSNAGFDDEQTRMAIEQWRDAIAAFVESVRQVWAEISRLFVQALRPFVWQLRTIMRLGIIPREYRDTMMRRKIRGAVSRGFGRRR